MTTPRPAYIQNCRAVRRRWGALTTGRKERFTGFRSRGSAGSLTLAPRGWNLVRWRTAATWR
jgi:hypothetical protein